MQERLKGDLQEQHPLNEEKRSRGEDTRGSETCV